MSDEKIEKELEILAERLAEDLSDLCMKAIEGDGGLMRESHEGALEILNEEILKRAKEEK